MVQLLPAYLGTGACIIYIASVWRVERKVPLKLYLLMQKALYTFQSRGRFTFGGRM